MSVVMLLVDGDPDKMHSRATPRTSLLLLTDVYGTNDCLKWRHAVEPNRDCDFLSNVLGVEINQNRELAAFIQINSGVPSRQQRVQMSAFACGHRACGLSCASILS